MRNSTRLKDPPVSKEIGWQYGLISKQDAVANTTGEGSSLIDGLGLKKRDTQESLFSELQAKLSELIESSVAAKTIYELSGTKEIDTSKRESLIIIIIR